MKLSLARHAPKFRFPLVLAIGFALGIPGAYADVSDSSIPSKTVSYADLDLNTPAGTEQLYRRIRDAAIDVCRTPDGDSLNAKMQRYSCEAHAIDAAVAKIGNPNLAAYYLTHNAGKSGRVHGTLDANNIASR